MVTCKLKVQQNIQMLKAAVLNQQEIYPQSRSDWPNFSCVIRVHQQVRTCNITSLCVQRLWFVPRWLTSRHTDRQHFDQLIWIAQPAKLKTTIEQPTVSDAACQHCCKSYDGTVSALRYVAILLHLTAQHKSLVLRLQQHNGILQQDDVHLNRLGTGQTPCQHPVI